MPLRATVWAVLRGHQDSCFQNASEGPRDAKGATTPMNKAIIFCHCLTIALLSNVASSQLRHGSRAIKICDEFCKEAKLLFDPKAASCTFFPGRTTQSNAWLVSDSTASIFVDDNEEYVLSYSNNLKQKAIVSRKKHGENIFKLESDAWRHGESLVSKIIPAGLSRAQFRNSSQSLAASLMDRITLYFDAMPEGIASNGQGNSLTLVLDSQTGDIVSLYQKRGWTYDPTHGKRIAKSEAKSIGASLLGVVPSACAIALQWVCPNGNHGSKSGADFGKKKHARLAYVVTSRDLVDAYIDATDGKCIGGMIGAGKR